MRSVLALLPPPLSSSLSLKHSIALLWPKLLLSFFFSVSQIDDIGQTLQEPDTYLLFRTRPVFPSTALLPQFHIDLGQKNQTVVFAVCDYTETPE